jgi:V8-like Glu-specific endopeptidase
MKTSKILIILFSAVSIISCSSTKRLSKTPIGLINNVSYKDTSFNNANAANGFLVQYKNNNYAVTAKHVLMIAKTDKMKFVDFEDGLKEWKMHPKNDTSEFVIMDKLLNSNRKDSLTWGYMDSNWDTYNDWLVFSIKENKSMYKPLNFRSTPLEKGENVYVIGWSYADTVGAQNVYEYTYDKTEGNYHQLIQKKGPESLGGLSGSPIVDVKGELVGLVTSGWEDEETKKVILEATTTENILQFITELK